MAKQRRKIVTAGRYCRAVQYTMITDIEAQRSRAPKELVSSCAREAINLHQSFQKLKAAIAANFDTSDLVVTLTYSDACLPPGRDAAEKILKRFIRQLRAERRAAGADLRYIYVSELGHSRGRPHHHIILNATGTDYDTLRRLWQYGDQIDIRRIADKGFDGWARYLSKEPREHGRRRVGERMWRNSRTLVKPIVDAGWVDAGDDLTAPPGAYILDRQERVNCYGRFAYLEYLLPAKT